MDTKVTKLIGKKPGGARGRGKGRGRGRANVAPPPTVPPNGFEGSGHEEEPEEPEEPEKPEIKEEVPPKKTVKGKGTADSTKESPDGSALMATRWKVVETWVC